VRFIKNVKNLFYFIHHRSRYKREKNTRNSANGTIFQSFERARVRVRARVRAVKFYRGTKARPNINLIDRGIMRGIIAVTKNSISRRCKRMVGDGHPSSVLWQGSNRRRAPNEACGVGHRHPISPSSPACPPTPFLPPRPPLGVQGAPAAVVTIINLIVIAPDHIRGITHGVVHVTRRGATGTRVEGTEGQRGSGRADRERADEFGTRVGRKERAAAERTKRVPAALGG